MSNTAADEAVLLTILRTLNVDIHDGNVTDSDPSDKVITAVVPYVVFHSGASDDTPGDSLAGPSGARLAEFQLTYVGSTREQVLRVADRCRDALNRRFVEFPAGKRLVRRTDDNRPVTRDDTWNRPGGGPLFNAVDRFAVLI